MRPAATVQLAQTDVTVTAARSNDGPERLLLTVLEVAQVLALGRTKVYELIDARELEVIHIGRAVRVPAEVVVEFVARKRLIPDHYGEPQSVNAPRDE